ncbi:aquaporin-2 [Drosophila ficusphila]|uniref:aquaporin-2 n=1 Tax=Drosophila ficusphila TaxID=30025 RepID=UPI0007E611A9|nr:aquaporin-2 [Drosophila ficusphila]
MIWDFFTFIRGVSEFSATALLMLFVCMEEAVSQGGENKPYVTSVHYGLVVMLVMHVFGFVSGAHANPCTSISCCFMGHISSELMIIYVACQLAGGFFGYFLLLQLLPKEVLNSSESAICFVVPMDNLSTSQILIIESVLTAVFVLGWCALWDVRNGRFLDSATIRMGLLVMACSFAGGQLTGASMNPARTLVPAFFQGKLESVLMQLSGQVLSAIMVPFIWKKAYTPRYKPLEIPIYTNLN